MRHSRPLSTSLFALGMLGAVASWARAESAPEKASELLIQATQGAISQNACDLAFLAEYVQLVAGELGEQAPQAYAMALQGLQSTEQRACLSDSLKSLGQSPGSD